MEQFASQAHEHLKRQLEMMLAQSGTSNATSPGPMFTSTASQPFSGHHATPYLRLVTTALASNIARRYVRISFGHPDVKLDAHVSSCRFPPTATSILSEWLQAHQEEPYPNDVQKVELSLRTGLSVTQVSNWFVNARRRSKK